MRQRRPSTRTVWRIQAEDVAHENGLVEFPLRGTRPSRIDDAPAAPPPRTPPGRSARESRRRKIVRRRSYRAGIMTPADRRLRRRRLRTIVHARILSGVIRAALGRQPRLHASTSRREYIQRMRRACARSQKQRASCGEPTAAPAPRRRGRFREGQASPGEGGGQVRQRRGSKRSWTSCQVAAARSISPMSWSDNARLAGLSAPRPPRRSTPRNASTACVKRPWSDRSARAGSAGPRCADRLQGALQYRHASVVWPCFPERDAQLRQRLEVVGVM